MKIAIYGKPFDSQYEKEITHLFRRLNENRVGIIVYTGFYQYIKKCIDFFPEPEGLFDSYYNLPEDVLCMISIGGDGTFLKSITYVWDKGIPVLGINVGRLGFLAEISLSEIDQAIDSLMNGNYVIENRSPVEVITKNNAFKPFNYALNETAVHKKDAASMIVIHTYLDDEYLNSYWADGLIVATPTGSTAYSMSVGGPILLPNAKNLIITPIAPHNLTVRPLVIPDDKTIRINVEGRDTKFLTTLDSRSKVMDSSEEIRIQTPDFSIKVLELLNYSYYSILRNKLMWGVDKRN